ncbi:lysM and putative peptidoglycan-binding domain-containing protein 1 [Hetaerina americana]|uniref:lysM and putative peptidoglycan-binding domain-containing protein 1 n=1 Tax=Hetaerina americana TaxID=62018 RepID=UPI003A7F119C
MADGGREEKRYIGGFAKSLKKYGSTCNHMKPQERLIKHTVSKSDTLQGIALKYGVTMEQIRRINRLWASDSLFLRESLLIPTPSYPAGQEELSSPELEAALANSPLSPIEFHALSSSEDVSSPIMRECQAANVDPNEGSQENVKTGSMPSDEKSVLQFLGEIDTSIAHTKNMVKKIQVSSDFRDEDGCGFGLPSGRRRPLHSRLHQNHQGGTSVLQHRSPNATKSNHNNNNNNHHTGSDKRSLHLSSEAAAAHGLVVSSGGYQGMYQGSPEPLPPVVMTQGRKVRSSMQRMEQEADEMFEL